MKMIIKNMSMDNLNKYVNIANLISTLVKEKKENAVVSINITEDSKLELKTMGISSEDYKSVIAEADSVYGILSNRDHKTFQDCNNPFWITTFNISN